MGTEHWNGRAQACMPTIVGPSILKFEGSQNTRKRDENWENFLAINYPSGASADCAAIK